MKTHQLKSTFFYALLLLGIASILFTSTAKGQNSPLQYYAVIGSFAIKENAERFNRRAIALNFNSKFGLNEMRQVYYVYVFASPNKMDAFAFANDIRTKELFADCWVFNGVLEEGDGAQFANIDQNPATGDLIDEIESTDLAPKSSTDKVDVPVVEEGIQIL